jgi:hypothetical protein
VIHNGEQAGARLAKASQLSPRASCLEVVRFLPSRRRIAVPLKSDNKLSAPTCATSEAFAFMERNSPKAGNKGAVFGSLFTLMSNASASPQDIAENYLEV